MPWWMNDHSWYTIESTSDQWRAGLWIASNIAVFLAYFLIPLEIWYWRKAITFIWTSVITLLFVAFIALCGISHLAMVIIMPTGPWWAVWSVFVPLAFVSMGTVVTIRLMRNRIIEILEQIKVIIDGGETRNGGETAR